MATAAAARAATPEPLALLGPVVGVARRRPPYPPRHREVGRPPGLAAVTAPELTWVTDTEVAVWDGERLVVEGGFEPGREVMVQGVAARTLRRPPGELLATVATVNDVHFGEVECGLIEGLEIGPVMRVGPGEEPHPETMNRAIVGEIADLDPDVVIAKGDLTTNGTRAEYQQFLDCYGAAFGDRLIWVRGNHDAYHGEVFADAPTQRADLPGATLAVLDTAIPGSATGRVTDDQLDWLDGVAQEADRPVLVFGHHHVWNPDSHERPEGYFGIHPDHSERLVALAARRPAVAGYFAGHTHRNRVRRFSATGAMPWVEVACTKDFPGTWAEYRIHEGGVLQVARRCRAPEALDWTERTRAMFGGMYPSYAFGSIDDRCFEIPGR